MVQTEVLLSVEVVIDTEVGHQHIGDIDYTICVSGLQRFIKKCGNPGRQKIIDTLVELEKYIASVVVE